MSSSKSERLLNLTIGLLSTKRYLTKDEVRRTIAGYEDQTEQAFERMFERDKEELRALGIPVETGTMDHYFADELGYRIAPGDFELTPIELTADEAAVLGVAARAWRESTMAAAARSAMSKLRSAGIEPDPERLATLEPVVTAREPSFAVLSQATLERVRVRFGYRGSTGGDSQIRTLEPWGLTSTRGRWYVVGRDVDREATRVFRLSRITDEPRRVSRPGAYDVPDDLDLREFARGLEPPQSTGTAVLAIRRDRAPSLRRRGTPHPAGDDPVAVALPEAFEVYDVGYVSLDYLVPEVAAQAADVVVLDPPELRAQAIEHLQAVVARHGTTVRTEDQA